MAKRGPHKDPWWSAYDQLYQFSAEYDQSNSLDDLLGVFHPEFEPVEKVTLEPSPMLSAMPTTQDLREAPSLDPLVSCENYDSSRDSEALLPTPTFMREKLGHDASGAIGGVTQDGQSANEPTDTQIRRSGRIRNPTEVGYQSQRQVTIQEFQNAIANHKRSVTLCEKTIKGDNFNVKALTDYRNRLETSIVQVSEAFHKMVEISPERYEQYIDLVNERETVNLQMLHDVTNCLRFVDVNHVTALSEKTALKSSKSSMSKSVTCTQRSGHSSRSKSSHTSTTVLKANVAALKAQLHFYDKEAEHKAQLERLQMLRNIAVEEAKIAAFESASHVSKQSNCCSGEIVVKNHDQTNSAVQCVSSETNLQPVVNKVVDSVVSNVNVVGLNACAQNPGYSVSNVVHSLTNPLLTSHVNTSAANAVVSSFPGPKRSSPVDNTVTNNVKTQMPCVDLIDWNDPVLSPVGNSAQNNVFLSGQTLNCNAPEFVPGDRDKSAKGVNAKHEIDPLHQNDLVNVLGNYFNISRLPVPKPGKFSGEPLQYPAWRMSFQTLIEGRNISPAERIHYLKEYLIDDAYDCVESLLLNPSADSYFEAIALIDKRYGNSYTIACAFKSKIANWPKIGSRDSHGLRKFSDYLKQCEVAARSNPSLRVLNDDTQNRLMLEKLPDWLVSRWARVVHRVRENTQLYPSFAQFVSFLCNEADIACEPLTLLSNDRKMSQPTSIKFQKGQTLHTIQENPPASIKCIFCDKSNHTIDKCFKFKAKTMEEKRSFIMERKLCFGCLKPGHPSKQCKKRLHCAECNKRHPTPLHGDVKFKTPPVNVPNSNDCSSDPKTSQRSGNEQGKPKVSLLTSETSCSKSTMIVPVYISHASQPSTEILTYALLDTQSDTSFISDHLLSKVGIQGTATSILLSTMTCDKKLISCRRVSGMTVRAFNRTEKITLPVLFSRDHIPGGDDNIPSSNVSNRWPHLRPVVNQLMPKSNCGVGLLIGYNCPQALVPREVVPPIGNGPFAQRTDLGWGIIGLIDGCDDFSSGQHLCSQISGSYIALRTSAKEVLSPAQISQFFSQEEGFSGLKTMSQDEVKFLSLMREETHRTSDGHYEMPLPFRNPRVPPGPNNKPLALQRLKSLVKRFRKDPQHHQYYVDFMNNLLEKGYAERVPLSELSSDTPAYYLPHHGVYNPSKPGKVRVVMDGSAKYMGKSLNDQLLVGPDLMNNLVGVLCRFRTDFISFMCDIQGMFQQFRVNYEHRNYLRFFWFENGVYENDPVEFRSTVHLFGAASSPAVANFGLKQAATDYEQRFGGDVKEFVHRNFYVDDGLMSVATVDEAISLVKRSTQFCAESGLVLHKFVSNSRELLDTIPISARADSIKDLDVFNDHLPVERALGVKWCITSDTFKFRIMVNDKPFTRRGVLSTVCSIFDPLGLIAPVVLQGKQILQLLCKDQLDWDDPIPDSIRCRWEKWLQELHSLELVEVSRCFKPENFKDVIKCEMHSFSDASLEGYGQCAYLRLQDSDGKVHCSLVLAKSRVAPLKTITVPRLELSAAVLSAEVSTTLKNELSCDIDQFFWTDSKIVLGFIANTTKKFQMYVANRVQKILDNSTVDQWHHVRTADNPADIVSRGCTAKELVQTRWFLGPQFLWNSEIQYKDTEIEPVELPISEIKRTCLANAVTEDPLQPFRKFSSWNRIVNIVALCFRFIHNARTKTRSAVKVDDLTKARNWIILQMQQEAFSDELKLLRSTGDKLSFVKTNSKLCRLDPFLDKDGLIRVGGRIQQSTLPFEMKHPVIIPKDHFLTVIMLQHFHESAQHQGKGITSNLVRSHGLWIIGLSSLVSSVIFKCVVCRRVRHTPVGQKMSNLPEERVDPSPPFTHVAVDYFGPFYIKDRRKELKRYGVLFTCLSSRAIHIETANSLDTDSFVNALRRILCLRGPMRTLRSDRGTNIVGGINQLSQAENEIDDEIVRNFLLSNSCDYVLNVPDASHQGGVWERQIRSVRSVLNTLLHQQGHQLNDEGFRTLMAEACNIVNSRPLTTNDLNDPCSLQPLTPNHLLTLKTNVVLPPPGNFQSADIYSRKLWRRVQHLSNEFWSRWKKEYLLQLNVRSKWHRPKRNLCIGDIVIVMDDSLPRCFWKLAKISQVYPCKDGLVRKVQVQLGKSDLNSKGQSTSRFKCLDRPAHKLILLLESNNNA